MEKKIKRYIKKRQQIENIISAIEIEYESFECYHSLHPDWANSRKVAENILSKFGINKPNSKLV